ncbi:MAG: transcriptional repressor LexA [bacterium]|nr:transcriptional repressor LexA [bacterium]
MTHIITERQQFILDHIRAYIERTGYSPSVRDLADLCNIKSTQGIMRHLRALEDKGFIQRDSKARSIRIIKPAGPHQQAISSPTSNIATASNFAATMGKNAQLAPYHTENSLNSETELVPLVGQVAAGVPIAALENIEEHIPVSKNLLTHAHSSFLLRVKGDSMKEGIQPGDLILVTPGLAIHRHDIVVAVIDDEATVKRYYPETDRVILRADNPNYADIIVSSDLRLAGKVTGLIRQY